MQVQISIFFNTDLVTVFATEVEVAATMTRVSIDSIALDNKIYIV